MTANAISVANTAEIIGTRYRILSPLGVGGMGQVYRAFDRLTERYVALKIIVVNAPADANITLSLEVIDLRLALAHEFQALSGLRHPNIVTVLDYGFENKQPYLVMELLEHSQTIIEAGLNQPFSAQLSLLAQILQALAYLHRHGIVHRDLKPSNILVVNGQLKLLDFGLAAIGNDDLTAAGTLLYMAPEVLQGSPASVAGDLYTVGVVMYEMFTGRHPLGVISPPITISHLIDTIITTVPDFSDLDERIAPIVARLLEKEPQKRFGGAMAVINTLNSVAELPLLAETETTRESFLQAARFVGREHELALLMGALTAPTTEGTNNLWLIGGESGVGKSRLLDEIRTRVLVQGRLVMRGQAISEGGSAYQLWRDILRWLCLRIELTTLEASILKTVIPDIGRLLDRDIPDAPTLEISAMQERFMEVFSALFTRQTDPILIILEDLHWAGSEDLLLLKRLPLPSPTAPQRPVPRLIIMASYRDDESPRLPDELPGAKTITLPRLTEDDITQLSESMLGSAGRQADVIGLLQKETEGNVFFLIEIVRVLAEEAGTLANVGRQPLPQHVLSGGVQQIIRRRLSRISPEARPLLRLAAVAGRQIDLELMQRLAAGQNIARWLSNCADVAVLEIVGQQWRFSHDKLRETLLAELEADESCRLNKQVATSLEQLHGLDPQYAAALVYHWSQADNPERKAHYARIAGKHALANAAYQQAVSYFHQYLDWSEAHPTAAEAPHFQYQRASIEQQLAMAYYSLADLYRAHDYLHLALQHLGWPAPTDRIAIYRGALRQASIQFVAPVRWLSRLLTRSRPRHILQLTANIDATLSQIEYINGQMPAAAYHTLHLVNVAEQTDTLPELAIGYANLTLALAQFQQQRLAHDYVRRSRQAAQKCGQPAAEAYALTITSIYQLSVGDWSEARQAFEQALHITQQIGERRREHEVLTNYGFMLGLMGEFEHSFALRAQMLDSATRGGDLQARGWSLSGMGEMYLWRGNLTEASVCLQARLELNQKFTSRADQSTTSHALLALIYWRTGRHQAMRTEIDAALSQLKVESFQVHSYQGIASLSEVLLNLWEAGSDLSGQEQLKTHTRPQLNDIIANVYKVLSCLTAYARLYRIGRSWLWRNQGTAAWLAGDPAGAQKLWTKAISTAVTLKMPLDEGWARYEIGRHMPTTDSQRYAQLEKAALIFADLGAVYHLSQTRQALSTLANTDIL